MANEQPASRGNPEEADCLSAPEGTQENQVEILPPEEKPSADPQVPLRDYSANYRPLQPKPSAPEPPKPSTAAEHYRNSILISSAQKTAKQTAKQPTTVRLSDRRLPPKPPPIPPAAKVPA